MEHKKPIKISLKMAIILICVLILIAVGSVFIYNRYFNKGNIYLYRNGNSVTIYSNTEIKTSGREVEYDIKTGYYSGRKDCIENAFVSSYDELEMYLSHFGEVIIEDSNVNALEIFDKDFFKNNTIAIEAYDASFSHNLYEIDSVTVNGTEANINITHTKYSSGGVLAPTVVFSFIILDDNITNANFNINTKNVNNTEDMLVSYKPIIYLYPNLDMEVFVKLKYNENITVSYPKYINGWNVLAKKDGTLTDLTTARNLYALYWEGENIPKNINMQEGFCIKGEDTAKFLEKIVKNNEKVLAILGDLLYNKHRGVQNAP